MVIVGAGEAGARAAVALRENGFRGPVTLIGEESHRPYERPPLSKAAMTAEADPDATYIVDETRLADHAIEHRAGATVVGVAREARRVLFEDGTDLPYDKLLLATGARPRKLAIPGAGPENVLYLRTFADALAMRQRLAPGRRLVVIGGGFIGLEIASSAIARGCDVTRGRNGPAPSHARGSGRGGGAGPGPPRTRRRPVPYRDGARPGGA